MELEISIQNFTISNSWVLQGTVDVYRIETPYPLQATQELMSENMMTGTTRGTPRQLVNKGARD